MPIIDRAPGPDAFALGFGRGLEHDLVLLDDALVVKQRGATRRRLGEHPDDNDRYQGMFDIGSRKWPGISKLIEECGEVVQVCGKLIGNRGEIVHWNVPDLKVALEEEIADVLAACRFVIAKCGLDQYAIVVRANKKQLQYETWHVTNPEPE